MVVLGPRKAEYYCNMAKHLEFKSIPASTALFSFPKNMKKEK